MTTHVNLRELAINRSSPPQDSPVRRRRNILTRYFVPAAILGSFVGVIGWSVRDRLWPAKPVTVITVIASRSEVLAADTPLFQAAGWIEPRPQPTVVSALSDGIVDEMLVVEGQVLEPGQVVARLVRHDAELELKRAEADVQLREAELLSAKAGLIAAKAMLDDPLPLQAVFAEAEAALTKIETELARLPSMMRATKARREFAEYDLAGKTKISDSVPVMSIQKAKADLETALAQQDEHRQQTTSLELERQALIKRRNVLRRQLEFKIEETRQYATAQAMLHVAESQVQLAEVTRDSARLKLDRTEVRARVAGHVMSLVAKPGSRLMGINQASAQDAATVLTMYDPRNLQVRADVRLDDVRQVTVGQRVRMETSASAEPLTGSVLVATALTDIQKNTLQVKVSIDDPPPILKPEMLVQVTFFAPPRTTIEGGSLPLRLLAPQEVIQGSGSDASVWIADQASATARLRRVTLGSVTTEGLIEVVAGLNVGDRLIVSGRELLVDGEHIQVTGIDSTIGRRSSPASPADATATQSSQIQRSGASP